MSTDAAPEIPGYSIGPAIGRGGLAVVYAGTQRATRRDVALKVLNAPLTGDPAARLRFESEVQAMAMLDRHRNIARIVDVTTTTDGRSVIVMDHYRQGSFAGRLARGPLKAREVLQIGVQLCAALESAHLYGVWHRDVKPANILIGDEGEPKLNDFGIAAVATAGSAGFAVGWSPAFVPPEVLRAAEAGLPLDKEQETQWDTYSLSVTLYALLSLRTPYEETGGANGNAEITARVRSGQPALLTSALVPGAPPALLDLLNQAVARDPSQRPRRPSELFLRLRAIEQSMGVPLTEYRPFLQESLLPGGGTITEVPPAGPTPFSPPPLPGAAPPVPHQAPAPAWSPPASPGAGVYIERADAPAPGAGPTSTELNTRLPAARTPAARPAAPADDTPQPLPREKPAQRPRGRLIGIGAAVIAVLALAGWGASFLLTGTKPTAAPTSGPSAAVSRTPTPQTVVRPLPVAEVTSVREGTGVRFSWTYSDIAEGDWFSVVRTDMVNPTPTKVTEPNIFIDDPNPCIDVRIVRVNGQVGPPVRACFP